MKNPDHFHILSPRKAVITRPIVRVGGKTYSATWVPVGSKDTGTKSACVIFDDTFEHRFCEVGLDEHKSFEELEVGVQLDGFPRPNSVLSTEAYQNHVLNGQPFRPMSEVFLDVSRAIDSFVAFDDSFANQQALSDYIACWIVATYATDVFDTTGYLWPSGEKASGKTQCLKTISALSFMGLTVTSSSTFASIRDEASLGATLLFDDCENLRGMDPSKRELLLAGNTKGTVITLKEPGKKEGEWVNRQVDAFAPRAFTSISMPDDVLASRTVIVPLVRSNDTIKTRRKPTSPSHWHVPASQLRDETWLNVVKSLESIEASKEAVGKASEVSGRDFDVFQGPLAIAQWLEQEAGLVGLFDRMLGVMEAYHSVKHENHLPSLEELVITVLFDKIVTKDAERLDLETGDIVTGVGKLCRDTDITDESLREADAQKVGTLLGRLGFQKSKSHGRRRSWIIRKQEVYRQAKALGVYPDTNAPIVDPDDRSVTQEVDHDVLNLPF